MTDSSLRALSVARPWAGLIIAGHKPIENRTWSTRYRGLLVIHASKRWDRAGIEFAENTGMSTSPGDHPTGYLGHVHLVDMHRAADCGGCSPWALPGCWHWQISNPEPFHSPEQGPGRLGLFLPPTDVLRLADDGRIPNYRNGDSRA
jgi:hypothetical protein